MPGAGVEPRTPQKRTRKCGQLRSACSWCMRGIAPNYVRQEPLLSIPGSDRAPMLAPHELRRAGRGVRSERPGGGDHDGALGLARARARGLRACRRRGGDAGADAAGLPPRHVLGGVSGGGGLAGVRRHGTRAPRPALGSPPRLRRAPAGRRLGGGALPRPRAHGGESRGGARGRRRTLGRVRGTAPAPFRCVARHDAGGLSAGRGNAAPGGGARRPGNARLHARAVDAGAGAGAASCSKTTARAPGCTVRRCTRTRRWRARAARSRRCT